MACFSIAGLFGLFGLAFTKTGPRPDLVRWAASWVIIPLALVAPAVFWYFKEIPSERLATARTIPYWNNLALAAITALAVIALLAAAAWVSRGKRALRAIASLMMLLGLAAAGLGEWIREDLRLPYLVAGEVYANDIPAAALGAARANGIMAGSRWFSQEQVARQNEALAGKEIFISACSQCHTVRANLMPLGPRMAAVDEDFASWLTYRTAFMRGGMPPFPGTEAEAEAVAHYLRVAAMPELAHQDGRSVFERRCGPCHTLSGPFRPVLPAFEGEDANGATAILDNIRSFSEQMPKWTGSQEEKKALAEWLAARSAEQGKKGAP